MKKLILFPFLFIFAGIAQVFSANPIPSYNVKVNFRANFQEMKGPSTNLNAKERRIMNIETSTSSPNAGKSASISTVYVYKMNGSKVLGPFYIGCGELLTVEIDNSRWGAVIEVQDPEEHITADVWIGSGSASKGISQTNPFFPAGL